MENINEIITTTITELLQKLSLSIEKISIDVDEKTKSKRFVVATPDSALLIGEHGARLMALNHVVKKIIEKKVGEHTENFMVDVNDYQKRHIDELRSKAQVLAERARYFKSSVEMDPMSAYERMIVHAEFTDVPDILTASEGVGRDRRVVLRFTENKVVGEKL